MRPTSRPTNQPTNQPTAQAANQPRALALSPAANQPPAPARFADQGADETAQAYGRRALEYLLADRYAIGMLPDAALESAYHFSAYAVVAPEMALSVRDRLATIRLDLSRSLLARKRETERAAAAPAHQAAPAAPASSDQGNWRGRRVALPRQPRPLAPAGGAARPF